LIAIVTKLLLFMDLSGGLAAASRQKARMTEIVLAWAGFKDVLAGALGLTHHDLHLLLGVLLTIGIGWLLRLPLGSWLPLLAVLALEAANEVSDFTRFQMAGCPRLKAA
jgi:hypothetical protein